MANKQRGQTSIIGPEGKKYTLCLTLGAIARIEEELEGIESLTQIDQVFARARMRDVMVILLALLEGGGEEVTMKDLMRWQIGIKGLTKAIREAFDASGFNDDEDEEPSPGN